MRNSPLLPIFLIVLVDVLGMAIILPLLPFYSERLGASAITIGFLVASYAACQLIAGPILGQISDRVGRKPVLLVSQLGTLIGFLILARAQVLWLVFLSRIIDGATAGNLSLAQAYIADVTEPRDRSKSFAIIGIAFGVGFLIGPAISGYLSVYGYSAPVYAAASLSFTSILCTWFLLPTREPATSASRMELFNLARYAEYFRRPVLSRFLGQFFFFAFSFSTYISGFALFTQRRFNFGPREVGYLFAWVGFLGIVLQGGLIGRLVKRFGERNLVFAGFLSAAVGYTLVGLTFEHKLLYVVSVFGSFGIGVLRPAITSLVTQNANPNEQGVVLGLTQSITSVCQIFAPILAGLLIDRRFLIAWALVAAGSCVAGAVLAYPGTKNAVQA